ncbi:MAG: choice-of-anchor D domain-containing protein, partial [Candidatus Aminicenantes bacterium]|nr:choice-of-anchor D domain-containing protein [Candidatus Aminicenantes bacterium]NIN17787.1 choice-of-anchor D domain-containing protein [Candidatus Aminicenantes bacterium]NIN41689.1 choice-of-anchor D domain-containing protein [Candidatus Aminicenantes bacterium]NIN84438.1 choice-of-anchor D domain-containing protein [Candidatus Aminicenantes bacterium]NIO80590.1 choice-of-anchor D domain-containing protein [Candidatus Aminicenantes bacterium]
MKRLRLILLTSIILVFMFWLYTIPSAYADTLEVLPIDHYFGDVEVGTKVTTIVSMTNINGSDVEVYGLGFQAGSSGDFSLANSPPVPFIVVPGETVDVEVAFSPSAAGYVTAVLEIESTDSLNPYQYVFFGGVGMDTQP